MLSPCFNYLTGKCYLVNNVIISFPIYNLLAVIVLVCKVSMYRIVKDVASLITMSSENHSLTALSLQGLTLTNTKAQHFQTWPIDVLHLCGTL